MRNASHKSKLATLMHFVDQWKVRVGSREAVAVAIVDKHIELGLDAVTGIRFERSGDAFTLAKNAADRIFRWLDDKTKDANLMPANFEQSILAAMPDDLRLMFMNDYLTPLGMSARPHMPCLGEKLELVGRAHASHKETSEAVTALLALATDPSASRLRVAHQETIEAIHQLQANQAAIEKELVAMQKVSL
ncbi:hypothetical protein [Alcaligenes endophyticus]|uniref:Bacterial toxin YdaT domain-containing protein n=1 Tax=Alcaligenes endophyticus TaxID=1929088 RepID=A0ABT8EIX1_9BURK|nr:hypothetical protein [Alcaligenes endophyticus]MCX5592508.1 hypothetical protein [Alcaligenes endophyticus]MDN4121234.1 hypothetical protein [Alcaligenes endophyticus]